jgi:hypothetical protein
MEMKYSKRDKIESHHNERGMGMGMGLDISLTLRV